MNRYNLLELSQLDPVDVITLNPQGQEISRVQGQVLGLREYISNSIILDMVAIPAGSFKMGSPENELERYPQE